MVNNHDFVQEEVYANDHCKHPSIICYTAEQLSELNYILNLTQTLSLVYLGSVYVTDIVFKNKKIISKSTRDHPIFVGPVFFHRDGSFCT